MTAALDLLQQVRDPAPVSLDVSRIAEIVERAKATPDRLQVNLQSSALIRQRDAEVFAGTKEPLPQSEMLEFFAHAREDVLWLAQMLAMALDIDPLIDGRYYLCRRCGMRAFATGPDSWPHPEHVRGLDGCRYSGATLCRTQVL